MTSDEELLWAAALALRDVGKAALTVKPTLDKPYPDAPGTTPWKRFMGQPARHAYNLGCQITAILIQREQQP